MFCNNEFERMLAGLVSKEVLYTRPYHIKTFWGYFNIIFGILHYFVRWGYAYLELFVIAHLLHYSQFLIA